MIFLINVGVSRTSGRNECLLIWCQTCISCIYQNIGNRKLKRCKNNVHADYNKFTNLRSFAAMKENRNQTWFLHKNESSCTARTQLIRSHSLARFYFELSGNSN